MSRSLPRVVIINFISSIIISIVICDILYSFKLYDVMYIGALFGLYFCAVYGVKILVEGGKIPNDRTRFYYAIGFIAIFNIIFLLLIPVIFGDVLSVSDYLTIVFNGVQVDFVLNALFYLTVFSIIMLYFNYVLYKDYPE